jgi:DNA-binding MltR family transcriptional regulator
MNAKPSPQVRTLTDVEGDYDALFTALNDQSDLVCVIVATSFLNDALGALLHQFFIDSNTRDSILKPDRGTLGSLRAKSDVAYCLGLISKGYQANLVAIGELRNLFAHTSNQCKFTDPDIQKMVGDLNPPKVSNIAVNPDTSENRDKLEKMLYGSARRAFTTICTLMCSHIFMRALTIEQCTPKTDIYDR